MPRPNLLLITTDKQRYDALGLNGNRILKTRNLDQLGTDGVNFTRAYSTTPSCIPARRTILTGQSGTTHGLPGYHEGVEFNPRYTLPGLLGRAGYQTQLIGKLHQYPQGKRFGFDDIVLSEQLDYRPGSRFFGRNDYAEWLKEAGKHLPHSDPGGHGVPANRPWARPFHLPETFHQTNWLAEEAIRFVRQRRDPSCPWFLHLSFWAPHPPHVPPREYLDLYKECQDWSPQVGSWVPAFQDPYPPPRKNYKEGPFEMGEMRNWLSGYYGLIHHVDDQIGYVLSRFFERGTARAEEPTWIVFCSDHGDLCGDHCQSGIFRPYEGCVRIPFLVSGRNVDLAPKRSDALVCLEDLLPTFCEWAGVDIPSDATVDGRSLVPILRGENANARNSLHGEHDGTYAFHFLIQGHMKYIWYTEHDEEQLFDLEADPHELQDLSGNREVLLPIRRHLANCLMDRTDLRYDPVRLKPLANCKPSCLWHEL